MSKIKLVLQPEKFSSFTSWYLESFWQQYFDIELYSKEKSYNKNTLFVFWHLDVDNDVLTQLTDQGHKVVVDNLWELPDPAFDKFYQLNNENWCWWNEALWWKALGYDQHQPVKTYKKLALMPIRRVSRIRDWVVDHLGSRLDQMIWSYKNTHLPNDSYTDTNDVEQRFFNPEWYNSTYVNLVIETLQHGKLFWTTDKTYKACAYYQPMLIVGQINSLNFLKQQGFETFDNIFDESYDQEPVFEKRFELILKNLDNIKLEPYSELTWQKLQHNHNHFFNDDLCKQGIQKQIIEPLLHYAET
jgi:hypothetical protein